MATRSSVAVVGAAFAEGVAMLSFKRIATFVTGCLILGLGACGSVALQSGPDGGAGARVSRPGCAGVPGRAGPRVARSCHAGSG